MKRLLPFLVLFAAFAYALAGLARPKEETAFDLSGFGELPLALDGRQKPFDTVARTSLLMFQGRQRVVGPAGETVSPTQWLAEVLFNDPKAANYQVFEIVHSDLLTALKLTPEMGQKKKRFSFAQIEPGIPALVEQFQLVPGEAAQRNAFQKGVARLYSSLVTYQGLRYSLIHPDSPNYMAELIEAQRIAPAGTAAMRLQQAGQPHDEKLAKALEEAGQRMYTMSQVGVLFPVPPAATDPDPAVWRKSGDALLQTLASGRLSPAAITYAALAQTWREGQSEQFNKIIELYRAEVAVSAAPVLAKVSREFRFNQAQVFYRGMVLCFLAFLLGVISWLRWPDALRRAAVAVLAVAFVLTTVGLIVRMWLDGRPPVTNLYSSAIFIGWGAVGLCLILEAIYRNAIGSVAGGMIGFAALIIAHFLSLSGDTLGVMQAVLDTNFWLATHVVIVTLGYASTYLAGFLAIIYVVRGVFTRSLDKPTADALSRMVYGIICFATLFSLVGTVLGGIWADQSWGRFWGWDPKENGALIIVIWNAIILHARWGGLVKQRGLMNLAIFGNIVTSWSWFGVNMLGVGLHSYGFMGGAFVALISFAVSQVVLIAIGLVPLSSWRSFGLARPEEVPLTGRPVDRPA